MAGKISELDLLTDPAADDLIEVLDVSEPLVDKKNKKFPLGNSVQPVEAQAGTTYTVVAADSGKLIRLTGTATITLPSGGPTTGQRVDFVCIGGPATFVLGGGATWDVPPTPSAVARAVGSFVTAIKMGTTTWALTGDLA
jgi:hypothetical protein